MRTRVGSGLEERRGGGGGGVQDLVADTSLLAQFCSLSIPFAFDSSSSSILLLTSLVSYNNCGAVSTVLGLLLIVFYSEQRTQNETCEFIFTSSV